MNPLPGSGRTLFLICVFLVACEPGAVQQDMSLERLMKPENCQGCHPVHFEQWSGSMHAYASLDPIFIAMHERGQRESGGELGTFCINCHAPLATRVQVDIDGDGDLETYADEIVAGRFDIRDLPSHLEGVNCYYCHTVERIDADHNNQMCLTDECGTERENPPMLGGISKPNPNSFHASASSPLLDGRDMASSNLCGGCHDIVTPDGIHIERTFHEWKNSVFGKEDMGQPLTCNQCHMPGFDGSSSAGPNGRTRRLHDHSMPGVDTALIPFPQRDEQMAAVQSLLDNTLLPRICVDDDELSPSVSIGLENIAAGHSWPSGAASDRRAWVEMTFYKNDEVIFQAGHVPEGEAVTEQVDPDLWRLGDKALDEDGEEVHLFWQAKTYESNLLIAPKDNSPFSHGSRLTHVTREYPLEAVPDRVEMRVKLRPMGLDIIDSLIDSGDLDAGIRDLIPTFTLRSTDITWSPDLGDCYPY